MAAITPGSVMTASIRSAAPAEEQLIDWPTALARLAGLDLERIERHRLDPGDAIPFALAVPASDGVASGAIAFDGDRALAGGSHPVILVREDLNTDDIAGVDAAAGMLTARGRPTSDAAVVAASSARCA